MQTSSRTKVETSRSVSKKAEEKTKASKDERQKLKADKGKCIHLSGSASGGSQISQTASLHHNLESKSFTSEKGFLSSFQSKTNQCNIPALRSVYDQSGYLYRDTEEKGPWTLRSFSPKGSRPKESSITKTSVGAPGLTISKLRVEDKPSTSRKKVKRITNKPLEENKEMKQFKQSLEAEFREAVNRCLTREKVPSNQNSPTKKLLKQKSSQVSLREYQLKSVQKLINFFDKDPALSLEKQNYRNSLQEFRKVTHSKEKALCTGDSSRYKIKCILGIR